MFISYSIPSYPGDNSSDSYYLLHDILVRPSDIKYHIHFGKFISPVIIKLSACFFIRWNNVKKLMIGCINNLTTFLTKYEQLQYQSELSKVHETD